MDKRENFFKDIDYKLILTILALVLYGFLVLSSATKTLDAGPRIMRSQKIATAIGALALVFLGSIDYRHWKYLYKLIYIGSVALLLATVLFGMGPQPGSDIRSWLRIGPVSFQPSEFVKIAFIICLASYLEEVHEDLNKPIVLIKVLAFAFLPIFLILRQPDAGTAMVYMFITAVMLFLAGIHWKYIALAGILAVIAAPIIWFSLENYQKDRFFDFLDPEASPTGTAWQYLQGRVAIGSGQFLGKGLYKGTQTQFGFIPERQNDFIFPVVAEELGFVGGIALIGLYLFLLFRMYRISKESIDYYGSFMVIGIAAMFLFHIFENIGMTLGVVPITGIPLPFISSGGTFQLTNMIMIGLVLSVSGHKNIKYF
ncbi:MAG: rod shape-determining protein RodA [Bacillota bacterium]|nr:rod shape-determining protein RodA [Bacillota bacterium]